jgi:hypothetical protein
MPLPERVTEGHAGRHASEARQSSNANQYASLERVPMRAEKPKPTLAGKDASAISEWQINQLKMQAKSVEKSMGEVD